MSNPEFDQTFVTHMLAEHRRLHRMLVLACRSLAAESSTWPVEFEQSLLDLKTNLQRHFAEEEQGGCLDQAVSLHPKLSPQLKHIEEEHPKLLTAVDRLLAQAKDARDTVQDRTALLADLDSLCRDLHAHEAAESEILRRGFDVELESEANGWNG